MTSEHNPPTSPDAPLFDAEQLRRLEACVHACRNYATEDLEAGIIDQMHEVLILAVPLIEDGLLRREELQNMKLRLHVG